MSKQQVSTRLQRWAGRALRTLPGLLTFLKQALPGLTACFIISLLIVIRPVSTWTGPYSFLAFPFLHLFFYPAPATAGAHLEAVVLGILGAVAGLGVSFLAVCGAVWTQNADHHDPSTPIVAYESPRARVIGAIVLVLLSFICAYIQSRYVRLKEAGRICLFVSIWAITTGATKIRASIFLSLFWPALIAGVASLITNWLVFPKTGNQAVAKLLIDHVIQLQSVVHRSVQDFFGETAEAGSKESPESSSSGEQVRPEHHRQASAEVMKLREQLLSSLLKMRSTFHEAAYEVSWSRVSSRDYKSLLPIFRRLRAWVSCGMGLHDPGKPHRVDVAPPANASAGSQHPNPLEPATFKPVVTLLAEQITASLETVRMTIETTLGVNPKHGRSGTTSVSGKALTTTLFAAAIGVSPKAAADSTADRAVLLQRKRLKGAVEHFREELQGALDRFSSLAKAANAGINDSSSSRSSPPGTPQGPASTHDLHATLPLPTTASHLFGDVCDLFPDGQLARGGE
jgi:Putative ER transporter, 6TM, N-terminal